jgi:L-amino acid N-acyltransferase YncA
VSVELPVDECVERDRLNMPPVLAAAGEAFDPAARRDRLAKSLARNGQLVGVWRGGRLAGYAELRFVGGRCALWSIQVHPRHQHGPVLLGLPRLMAAALDPARVRVVTAAAHAVNEKSLRLHRLLGFREAGVNGDKVVFETQAAELVARLRTPGKATA